MPHWTVPLPCPPFIPALALPCLHPRPCPALLTTVPSPCPACNLSPALPAVCRYVPAPTTLTCHCVGTTASALLSVAR